jgi:hypothetical protein
MRFTFLLLMIFTSRILGAQCDYPEDVNRSLIITEARLISENWTYLELTNVGTKPIFMSQFKIGKLSNLSWSAGVLDLCNDPWWMPARPAYCFLPEKVLMPGQSWVITTAFDFGPKFYKENLGRLGGNERPKQTEMYEVADKLIHMAEPIRGVTYPEDSISNPYDDHEQTVKRGEYTNLYSAVGGGTYFIEHHYIAGDSAVVDQVGGFFDGEGGRNITGKVYDVAGVYNAIGTCVLVRKNTIKNGNIDFANSVGISLDDSDWIPIPMPAGYNQWRDIWWTIGNHGNYVLDENTLEPTLEGMSVDYAGKKITVPWGIRRLDDIMRNMKRKPGVAWNYVLNDVQEDSLYRSARTGDKLIVYVVGNTLTTGTFDIVVSEPTADVNIVVPIDHRSSGSLMTPRTQNGILDWPRVTKHESGIDTITGQGFGLEFDLRVDTLFKYLEKPANASWEIVWVDGIERADLKNGDKLKVTSQSGKVKEYFIQVQTYLPSSNANLSAITFPDLPDQYKNFLGWKGDTIPTFSPGTRNYKIEVPFDVDGVPALVPTTQDYNARVKTTRARSVSGSIEDRTILFEVTAEDDSTVVVYSIELVKEKHPDNVEPFYADPFFSEFVNAYTRNCYLEIYNPGTLPVDLRNYAFGLARFSTNAYDPILSSQEWLYRYSTYIPGLKYVDSLKWQITPQILEPDVNVNPILNPGETFVMALIQRDDQNYGYFPPYNVNFKNENVSGHPNPWNENTAGSSSRGNIMPPNGNRSNSFYMYRVLNDSIKEGKKPVMDPNDFEVIDVWGMEDGGYWILGDYVVGVNGAQDIYKRKPHITKGNPVLGGAFAPGDPEACEWIRIAPGSAYPELSGEELVRVALGGVGSHFMEPITKYRSTLNSMIYRISPGYGAGQEIKGIVTGTTVSEFLTGIYKEDENQILTFTSGVDTLTDENAVLSMNDLLVVLSADSTRTTYYRLDVTDQGLSSNAVLTSTRWSIDITVSPDTDAEIVGEATISGYEFTTTLKALLDNINVPSGASVTLINNKGDYVALKTLNYDTVYVDTKVSPNFSLDVLAEDNKTRIIYNLVPTTSESDAFIYSDVYLVSQVTNLIEYVPFGIAFDQFLNNIIPSYGSTLKLIDKTGIERTMGKIKADDKVVVTSANGEVSNSYYISLLFPGGNPVTYLAYIVSDSYAVNQVDYTVSGTAESPISNTTSVAEFMQHIIPSTGATVVIFDAEGNAKISGNLAEGDIIQVTSGDGVLITYYEIFLNGTSSRMPELRNIAIYPNPTEDQLNIDGLNPGNRIRIYNIHGKLMKEVETHTGYETIRLDDVPEGLFLITISDENRIIGQFKAVKK